MFVLCLLYVKYLCAAAQAKTVPFIAHILCHGFSWGPLFWLQDHRDWLCDPHLLIVHLHSIKIIFVWANGKSKLFVTWRHCHTKPSAFLITLNFQEHGHETDWKGLPCLHFVWCETYNVNYKELYIFSVWLKKC